jgi:hypothetical protein
VAGANRVANPIEQAGSRCLGRADLTKDGAGATRAIPDRYV